MADGRPPSDAARRLREAQLAQSGLLGPVREAEQELARALERVDRLERAVEELGLALGRVERQLRALEAQAVPLEQVLRDVFDEGGER